MTSSWNTDLTFQCHPSDSFTDRRFSSIDFLPRKTGKSGIFSPSNFESFRNLVERANSWLSNNPFCRIVTCETVEFRNKRDEADITKMIYVEHGETTTYFLRGLRLWVEPSSERNHPIDYMNILPQVIDKGGVFRSKTYESLDAVISKANDILKSRPLPGRIINIENQEMKIVTVAQLDPDKTNWEERGDVQKNFTFLLRIFYEKSNEMCDQQIGVQDFVPNLTKKAGIFSFPEYEPFSRVVAKASDWCSRQYGFKVCNMQALNIKVKRDEVVDTKRMDYGEYGSLRTHFVRILRVNYVQSELYYNVPPLPSITCKTFFPVLLKSGLIAPDYETLSVTKSRLEEWVRVAGVQVLNAETGVIRLRSIRKGQGAEETFSFNEGERDQYWVYLFRLYIIGQYHEPPPGLLKPVPDTVDSACTLL